MISQRVKDIKNNIEKINSIIHDTSTKCGRNYSDIKLMAVSKTRPPEDVMAAYNAGQRLFGENRIVEAHDKFENLPKDIELHMIGNLQSNKANITAKTVSCVQSIHKIKTAKELNKRAQHLNKKIEFLLEVNTSGEASKEGYKDFKELLLDLDQYQTMEYLQLRGLMTVGPLTDDEKAIRSSFSNLYKYFEKLKMELPDKKIDILSMGMSLDFKIAIEEGSTLVRVGTAIFGSRNYC